MIDEFVYKKPWEGKESFLWLERLTSGDKEAIKIELEKCKRDPWHFITHYIYTENPKNVENPLQIFPFKPHLYYLVSYLRRYSRLLIPKSRQLTVTWTCCAYFLHRALFFPSRMIFFSSKKEEDASALIERTSFMYENLPKFIRSANKLTETHCNMRFANRSHIHAAPDGPEHTRGYTITDFFGDEAVYTTSLKETLAASLPAIGQHGNIVLVSSVGPSHFQELVLDE